MSGDTPVEQPSVVPPADVPVPPATPTPTTTTTTDPQQPNPTEGLINLGDYSAIQKILPSITQSDGVFLSEMRELPECAKRAELLEILRRELEGKGESSLKSVIDEMKCIAEPIINLLRHFPTAFVAGGSIESIYTIALDNLCGSLVPVLFGDIDIYILDDPALPAMGEALKMIAYLKGSGLKRSNFALSIQSPLFEMGNSEDNTYTGCLLKVSSGSDMIRAPQGLYVIPSNKDPLQIILEKVTSIPEALERFDLQACRAALYGGEFFATEAGLRALLSGVNIISSDKAATISPERARKYCGRGYDVLLPPEVSQDFFGIDPVALARGIGLGSLLTGEINSTKSNYCLVEDRRSAYQMAVEKYPNMQVPTVPLSNIDIGDMMWVECAIDVGILKTTGTLPVLDFARTKITDTLAKTLLDGVYPFDALVETIENSFQVRVNTINGMIRDFTDYTIPNAAMDARIDEIVSIFEPLRGYSLTPPFTKCAVDLPHSEGVTTLDGWLCKLNPDLPRATPIDSLITIAKLLRNPFNKYPNLRFIAEAALDWFAGNDPIRALLALLGENNRPVFEKLLPSLARLMGVSDTNAPMDVYLSSLTTGKSVIGDFKSFSIRPAPRELEQNNIVINRLTSPRTPIKLTIVTATQDQSANKKGEEGTPPIIVSPGDLNKFVNGQATDSHDKSRVIDVPHNSPKGSPRMGAPSSPRNQQGSSQSTLQTNQTASPKNPVLPTSVQAAVSKPIGRSPTSPTATSGTLRLDAMGPQDKALVTGLVKRLSTPNLVAQSP